MHELPFEAPRRNNENVKVRTEYSSASLPSFPPLAVLNKVVKKCHSAVNITGCPYGWKLENEEAKNREKKYFENKSQQRWCEAF